MSSMSTPPGIPPGLPSDPEAAWRIDAHALDRQVRRLAALPEAPWLHQEIARRMAEKLDMIRLQPDRWIDWSAFLGGGGELVRRRFPSAKRVVVEPHPALLARSLDAATPFWKRWWQPRRGVAHADLASATSDGQPAQLLWSNMALHGVDDKASLLGAWRDALAPEGMVMFSCLGPDTVRELKAVYRDTMNGSPGIDFWDMHDIGDVLVRSGFTDPVMDMEHLELTWPDAQAMFAELRTLGGNCSALRFGGSRTPAWRRALYAVASERLVKAGGRLSLTFEIIYGHAVVPKTQSNTQALTRISVQSLRQTLRDRRSSSAEAPGIDPGAPG